MTSYGLAAAERTGCRPLGPAPSQLEPFSFSRDGRVSSCSQVWLLMRHHDVASAQGQGIKRQGGDYGPRWVGHLQAELVAAARVPIVEHRGLELIIAHTSQGRFACEHCLVANDGQGSHGVALEHYVSADPMLDIKERTLQLTALDVLRVEGEVGRYSPTRHRASAS